MEIWLLQFQHIKVSVDAQKCSEASHRHMRGTLKPFFISRSGPFNPSSETVLNQIAERRSYLWLAFPPRPALLASVLYFKAWLDVTQLKAHLA